MKELLIFSSILICCITTIYSQEKLPAELKFFGGISLPANELERSRGSSGGFAQNGRQIGAELLVPLFKNFHLTFGYSNTSLAINREKYDVFAERRLRNQLLQEAYVTSNFTYQSTLGSYTNNSFFVGLNLDIPINEKLGLFINPSASYTWFTIPDISIVVTDSLYSVGASQSSSVENTFGIRINTGVYVQASDKLKVNFTIGYQESNHEYDTEAASKDQNDVRFFNTESGSAQYSTFNFAIGLQFVLLKKE